MKMKWLFSVLSVRRVRPNLCGRIRGVPGKTFGRDSDESCMLGGTEGTGRQGDAGKYHPVGAGDFPWRGPRAPCPLYGGKEGQEGTERMSPVFRFRKGGRDGPQVAGIDVVGADLVVVFVFGGDGY